MIARSMKLAQFRNYAKAEVSFGPRINLITGENAQGKTNLLEAIFYFSAARSFRTLRNERDLIRFGEQAAAMELCVSSSGREYKLEAALKAGQAKRLMANGIKLESRSELADMLRCVLFSPEDLSLIRDGAAARRRFMDQSLCQLRPRYYKALREYNRLYDHKLRILRDWEEKPDLLLILDDFSTKMAHYGAVLIHYRARFIARLQPFAAEFSRDCSMGRDKMEITYETVSAVTNPLGDVRVIAGQLVDHALSHRETELKSRQCLSGPHKDDLMVTLDGADARKFASQGQARTSALALKLAEREIHNEEFGAYPILLLDDVLSELDENRQAFVRERISQGQVFISCCTDEGMRELQETKLFRVEQGQIWARD